MTHKPTKVVTAKNLFSSGSVIVTTCFDEKFLFHVTTGRHCFHKSLSHYPEVLFIGHLPLSLKQVI